MASIDATNTIEEKVQLEVYGYINSLGNKVQEAKKIQAFFDEALKDPSEQTGSDEYKKLLKKLSNAILHRKLMIEMNNKLPVKMTQKELGDQFELFFEQLREYLFEKAIKSSKTAGSERVTTKGQQVFNKQKLEDETSKITDEIFEEIYRITGKEVNYETRHQRIQQKVDNELHTITFSFIDKNIPNLSNYNFSLKTKANSLGAHMGNTNIDRVIIAVLSELQFSEKDSLIFLKKFLKNINNGTSVTNSKGETKTLYFLNENFYKNLYENTIKQICALYEIMGVGQNANLVDFVLIENRQGLSKGKMESYKVLCAAQTVKDWKKSLTFGQTYGTSERGLNKRVEIKSTYTQ